MVYQLHLAAPIESDSNFMYFFFHFTDVGRGLDRVSGTRGPSQIHTDLMDLANGHNASE